MIPVRLSPLLAPLAGVGDPTPTPAPTVMAVASLDPAQWAFVAVGITLVVFAFGVLLAVKL